MATTIKLKNGSGAPLAGDLVQGEPAFDLTNKRLYTEDSGGTVIEVGTNPTSLTTGTFTSTGIDDNATSTAITIDASQNVGIGTGSPTVALQVSGQIKNSNGYLIDNGTNAGFLTVDGTNVNFGSSTAAKGLAFFTAATSQAMTIDSSGNVGIGTGTPVSKLDVEGEVRVNASADHLKLVNSATTARFDIAFEGGSGADALTFTRVGVGERMRIDASGNVNIGTSAAASGSHKLVIENASTTGTVNSHIALIGDSATTGQGPQILFSESGDGQSYAGGTIGFVRTGSNSIGDLVFGTRASAGDASTVTTEAMRIHSSGAVSINNTTNAEYLRIKGENGNQFGLDNDASTFTQANWYNNGTLKGAIWYDNSKAEFASYSAAELTFYTGGNASTAKATIDSSGNLLVGTTSTPSGSVGGAALMANNQIIASRGSAAALALYRPDSNGDVALFHKGSTQVGSISVTGAATAYNTSSDYRLKENIVDAPAGNIDAIRVRSFDWKADGTHQTYGMVAQELVDVAPEAVSQGETEDDMWAVDYSKLVPMMIKEIQDLRARVAQLEGA